MSSDNQEKPLATRSDTKVDLSTPLVETPGHVAWSKPNQENGKLAHGRPHQFTEQTADLIIQDIARGDTIREICARYGVNQGSIFYRMYLDSSFLNKYVAARRTCAIARLSKLTEEGEEIAAAVDTVEDIRRHDLKSRIWAMRDRSAQWHAERSAPDLYAARQQIDMNISSSPLALREQAWKAREAEMRVVDNPDPMSRGT